MKYAFMSFSCPEVSWDEMLSLAGRFGYDALEPRIGQNHKHGVEIATDAAARKQIKEKAAEAGIKICCVATSCSYADPAAAAENTELTLRCIDLAADVDAQRIRVFGGRIPDGVSREQAADALVQSLASVAGHAQERGVAVCMETHDDWCAPSRVAEIMKRVNHQAIAVNWDIMHPVWVAAATMDNAFETLKPWVRHVHFHDGLAVGDKQGLCPVGEGDIDHRRALQLLLAASYDGYWSGEWIGWEPYEVHLPRELATMKRYEAEVS